MRLREKYTSKEIALCFPDFAAYRRLAEATRSSLELLGVAVYLVGEAGDVCVHMDPHHPEKVE
jgi:hypothetical protein